MRYLRSLLSQEVLPFRRSMAIAVVALAVAVAAVPALAGTSGSGGSKRAGTPAAGKAPTGGSAYERLVRLRRLGRKAPRGTHSASAAPGGKEIASRRTARSRTFIRSDGTYLTRTFPQAVNFRDGHGRFQPIDNRLVPVGSASRRQGYAFENAANSYRSFLPRNLSGPVLMAARGSWLSFRMAGADATATAAGSSGH